MYTLELSPQHYPSVWKVWHVCAGLATLVYLEGVGQELCLVSEGLVEGRHESRVTSDTSDTTFSPQWSLLTFSPSLTPLVPPGEDAEDADGHHDPGQEGQTQPHRQEYPGLGLDHHWWDISVTMAGVKGHLEIDDFTCHWTHSLIHWKVYQNIA